MIKWAGIDLPSRDIGSADADFNALRVHDTYKYLDKLIWIARLQGRKDSLALLGALVNQLSDAEELASYPGGLREKIKKLAPRHDRD